MTEGFLIFYVLTTSFMLVIHLLVHLGSVGRPPSILSCFRLLLTWGTACIGMRFVMVMIKGTGYAGTDIDRLFGLTAAAIVVLFCICMIVQDMRGRP